MESYDDDDLMSLIAQVADGDATREDAVAALKKGKVDALDVLVEFLARTGQVERQRQVTGPRIDVTTVKQPARAKRDGPPHQIPGLPFQLNGTLYDPQDVSRFDDTDLDFVAAGDRMLAFDDRSLLDGWLQSSVLTSQMSSNLGKASSDSVGAAMYWAWDLIQHTNFYENVAPDGGARLELRADTQFLDLTRVSMGVFSGNWNDKISWVQFVAMEYALLGEHVNFGGSRLLLSHTQDTRNLRNFGWNDRASSVSTWGPLPVPGHWKWWFSGPPPGYVTG